MDTSKGGWISLNTSIHTPTGSRFAELFRTGDEILVMSGPNRFESARIAALETCEYMGPATRIHLAGHSLTCTSQTSLYVTFFPGALHCGMGLLAEVGDSTLICSTRDPKHVTSIPGFRRAWIVALANPLEELNYRCYLEALRFGIPFADFTGRKVQNLSMFERANRDLNISSRGGSLLESLGIDREFPHLTNYSGLGLKPLNLVMFGDALNKKGTVQHRLSLEDDSRNRLPLRERARPELPSLQNEKVRIPGADPEKWEMWNVDVTKDHYSELLLLARTFASLDTIRIVEKGVMGMVGSLMVRFPGSNLNSLMSAPWYSSGKLENRHLETVEQFSYQGTMVRIRPDRDLPIMAGGTPLYIEEN